MNKELLVSADEFSLVLFPPFPVDSKEWLKSAYIIINEFIDLSNIELLLGKVVEMDGKKPTAYSQAFTIENVPWYFAIAVHEHFQHMGILIRFSGQAWAIYQQSYFEHFGQKTNIAEFLKMIESSIYTYRLSRIDLTADFKNYDNLSPHKIYNKLLDESYLIEDCKGRKAKRKISAVQNNMETETFYIGSRAENSQLLFRCYNKKKEQISTNGFHLEEALNCDSWTRFETSFKGNYAHQITEQLELVNNEIELSQFIASKITDKFLFIDVHTEEYTDFTKDLLSIVDNSSYPALRSEKPQNNSLSKSIAYICKGSGLFPLLYKIEAIWQENQAKKFLNILYNIYIKYYKKDLDRNLQLQSWINKNHSSLSQQTLESCFIGDTLSDFDINDLCDTKVFTLEKIDTPKPKNHKNTKIIADEEFHKLFNSDF